MIQGKKVNTCSSVQAEITMPNRCVAYGCSNTTIVEGITTYYFPKDITQDIQAFFTFNNVFRL